MAAVSGIYTTMWNVYLNNDLQFTSTSNFVDLNDQAYANWDFSHIDPTGAQKGGKDQSGNPTVYTAGDLAAVMAANPDLKVLSANGYFDAVTPFFQTRLTLDAMPLVDARRARQSHDPAITLGPHDLSRRASRTAMKADVSAFYDAVSAKFELMRAAFECAWRGAAQTGAHEPAALFQKRAGQGPGAKLTFASPRPRNRGVSRISARLIPMGQRALAGGGVVAIVELDGGLGPGRHRQPSSIIGQPSPAIHRRPRQRRGQQRRTSSWR